MALSRLSIEIKRDQEKRREKQQNGLTGQTSQGNTTGQGRVETPAPAQRVSRLAEEIKKDRNKRQEKSERANLPSASELKSGGGRSGAEVRNSIRGIEGVQPDELTGSTSRNAAIPTSFDEIRAELEIAQKEFDAANMALTRMETESFDPQYMDTPEYAALSREYGRTWQRLTELEKALELEKYATAEKEDTFWGQWGANYDVGELNELTNAAYNKYWEEPTEQNKAYAQQLETLLEQYQLNNAAALDDEGAKATWLTKDLAGYLPQLDRQLQAGIGGAAAGGAGGAVVGSVVPVVGTGSGAIWGARGGYVTGTGLYSYNQMRGAAFRELLAMGVDEETARMAADDEGVISGLIEAGDAGVDLLTLGTGKLIGKLSGPVLRRVATALAKYGINVGSEWSEEGSQQAVTIANKDRVLSGEYDPNAGWFERKFDLAGKSIGTAWDAATGKDTAARDEILEAANAGGRLAMMLAGVGTVTNNTIDTYAANKTGQNMSSMGGDVVQAMIETGLESGKNTESYKLATELQAKLNSGKSLSNTEIGWLQKANEEAIAAEQNNERRQQFFGRFTGKDTSRNATEQQSDPYTLEQLAQETVAEASQNAPVTLEDLARETVAEREASQQAVPYNAMSMENPVRKARDNAIKNTGYGENGIKAFTEAVDRSGESVDQMRAKFQTAYELGRFDTPREKVELVTELQKIAYNAGRLDYIDDLGKKVNTATAGAKSGFDSAGAPSFVTSTQTRIVDDLAKALGSKVVIGKSRGNAHITGSGTVVIADDFQTRMEGKDVSIVYHAAHEIGMHRLMQLAPTEGRAFINAMYNYMSEGRPQTATTLVEDKQSEYAEQDVSLSTDKAAEEVVANSILSLYENEEAFGEAVRRIMNGNDQQAKRGLRKFREIMGDIVKKLKAIIAKLTGKEKSEAQQALSEVEQLREMYENALAAAVKKNRELEATKNAAQTSDGDVQHSAKEYSPIREKIAKSMLDKISDMLGEQFPLSAKFDAYIKNTKDVVSSPTVTANAVELNGRSYFKAAKDEFIKHYKKDETVNMAGTGIMAALKTDVATESISKRIRRGGEQVLLDVIPHAKSMIEGGKLFGIERLRHTDNKSAGLFAYRVYNAFDYVSTDEATKTATTTPYVFVATVVQQYDGNSVVHIIRGIEIATYDRGKLGKSDESSAITGGKYKVAQLYKFVKSVPRDDGGLKYTAKEANDYLFTYTQKENGEQYSLKDSDYMAAVKRGDTETAQKMVDEAAEAAMPSSKIRGKDGKLMPVYHGTNDTFYKFDSSIKGGVNGTAEGFGIYTSDKPEVTEAYGDRQIKMYANITKPAASDKKTISAATLAKLIKDTCKKQAQKMVDDGEYDSVREAIMDTWVSNYVYTYDIGMERAYREVANSILQMNDNDMAVIQEVVSGLAIRDYAEANAFYRESLTPVTGFDGFVTQWENSNTGEKSNIILALNSDQLKSADPVTYDDNGDVIPLTERFNSENEDIRFSLKEQNNLLKENAKLKEVNESLREQFKTTTFAKVDKKSLDKFTKTLLKDYQSGADINEIRDALNDVYTYMANGEDGHGPAWNDLQERAYNVAVSILENASTVNDEMYQTYKGLRDRLRSYPISISSEYNHDIPGYESINDFRKANFGRMKITSDGTPVDIVYADLANTYPEFFDESEYVTQADQIAHIADVLDSLQPYEVNPYSGDMRRAATWLASDILERFYELPQAKPTFADKQAAKLTKQVIKDAKKLENLREQKKERIRELIRRNREKVKEATQKERAKRAEAVKEIKDHYKAKEKKASESRKARELRAKIMRHAQEMSKKLLRPTDKQHIPQELRGAVVELLEAINLESKYTIDPETGKRLSSGEGDPTKRTAKFTALKKQLKAIKARGGDGMVFDPSLLGVEEDGIPSKFDQVSAMSETPLHAMNSEQLTTVWEVLKAVETAISNANKTLSKSKFATTVDWAMAFEEDTASRRVKRSSEQHYTLDIETPYTFFSHFGDAGHSLYRMLRNAQDHQQIMQDELVKKIGQIASLERRNKLEKEATTFTTDRGEKLVLSKAHVMEMYLLSKRPQAYNHLIHGGIVQPEVGKTRRGTSVTLLTEVDVAKITSSLTAEERAMADKYQALTNLLAEWGNKASMKAYGYEKFGDPNYWPIHSASEHVQHTTEKGATQRARSIANMGSAKPLTPEATNTLDLYGIFSTFDNHAADMMDYAAWLLPMEDVNRLYNFNFRNDEGRTVKTMRDLLNDYGGAKSDRYWANLMTDIQNGVNFPADTAFEGLVSKMVGNTKRAAVAANLRVVIQQPTAMARASVVLDPDLLMLNMGKGVTVKAMVDGWAKAKKYSPIAARKAAGGFEIASNPKQLSEVFYKPETKTGKFVTGVKESGMLLPGWADAATWGILWNTCESQVKRDINDLKPGTDEFYEAVNELFTEVIDQTQVVDGVLQRSQAMRSSSSLMKQMTSFTGEPTQAGNMIMRAYDKVRYETDGKKRGKAIAVLSRAVSAYMVTAAINAFAQSLVDALRDDDDEKDYWEKVWKAWSGISGKEETWFDFARNILLASNVVNNLNPLTWIPVAKDILSLVQGYAVQRMDVSAFGDLINSITMTIKTITGDGKQTTGYAALKTMLIAGKLFNGFGGYNALRDIEGIVRTFQVETDDYLALYETEKLMTKPKNNVKVYTDMLYHAYTDDKEQYDELYKMMLKDGFKADELEKAIDSRKERDALAGTGYKSSKAAYDALYSMKQEKRTAEYDALRNKLLNATYQTVGGRTEKLFTAAKIDSAMQARKVADGIDAMGFSTTDGVYDTMYDELRSGDMSDYYKYVVSMMGLDVEPSDIESAMRSRAKEDGLSVDDLTEALAAGGFKPKYPVASEDGFDIDDLSTVQYKTYSRAYGDMIDELMDNFARNGFDGLVAEDANEWLSSAYSYAKETALEIATNGKYQSDTEWINDAQAAEENGVSVADYIITKAGYGSSAAKKMQEAREYGIDADMYTNFLDTLDEYDQPTESGKYGTFTQEEAARAIAAIPGLTREQRAYLWQSVNKGWKAKNNPWR